MPPPLLPLDDHLCFSLYGASMAIGRLYKPLLDEIGITYPQYLVLAALSEEDGQSVGRIAERLLLDPSTVTPLVKRLQAAGLVARARNPDDERQVIVTLTAAGREVRARSVCLGDRLFSASGYGAEQLRRLNEEVRALRDAVAAREEARSGSPES